MIKSIKRTIPFLTFLILLWITGCDTNLVDSSDNQSGTEPSQPAIFDKIDVETLQDIPRLDVTLPPEPRPWDTDASVLRDSIAANNGRAIIGLKAPGSEKMRANNGIREALTAQQFENGLKMLSERGIELIRVFESIGVVSVKMDPEQVTSLFTNPRVDYIEIPMNYRLHSSPPNSIAPPAILAQTTPWGINMIKAPQGWSYTTGGSARVLIIDTGMNDHEDLPNRPSTNCAGPEDGCSAGPPNWHGTHVSGIALARDNSIGTVGVAPGISDNRVYSFGACSDFGACYPEDVMDGLEYAISNYIDAVNMSLGGPYHSGLATKVSQAHSNNIVMVASAGNLVDGEQGGNVEYPAGFDGVIGVSGIKDDGSFAGDTDGTPCSTFSNHGSHVDISAPFWAYSTTETANYQTYCGTSMAAPHVTGAAALVRAQHSGWTADQVINKLTSTADHPSGSTRDDYYGHGVLDVQEAVTPPISVTVEGPTTIYSPGTYEWEAVTSGGGSKPYFDWWVKYGTYGMWEYLGPPGGNTRSLYIDGSDPQDIQIKASAYDDVTNTSDQDIISITNYN
jgi:subtilisin family serine protease